MSEHRKIQTISSLCTGCRSCEIACAVIHSESKTLMAALFEKPRPRNRIDVQYGGGVKLPVNCRHCDEPDCLFACKAGAVSKNIETGQVSVDLEKCVGCWMCVMVCPFGAVLPDEERGKAIKCDLCADSPAGPACVAACPTNALVYGTYEEVENIINDLQESGIFIRSA